MHGGITLESTFGKGTTATFWIPFKKPHIRHGRAMTIDPESLPERLKNEMSVSCGSTDFERVFGSSPSQASLGVMHMRTRARASSLTPSIPPELELPRDNRSRVKILVVEDK